MADARRVAVVGAGAAGLCAAKHLLAKGFDVTVFEMGSQPGGLWVYENDNGRSPAYASLHINSEAAVTGYRDFPFPDGTPLYPGHVQVREYLEAYADHFDLRRHIRFTTEVRDAEPLAGPGSRWRIRLVDSTEELFDEVVVATGHQGVPAHPPFRDGFTGQYLHAHDYRVPDPFEGRRVLVVGVGNSALDIAADICTVTASTVISARSPVLVMPRMVWGVPLSRILAKLEKPWLPWPVVRSLRELITRVVHGRMEDLGFVTPRTRTHPSTHPSVVSHIVWQRIGVRPGVSSVSAREVTFTDGRSAEFDVMIAATGYEVDLPFLPAAVSPVVERRVDLYRRIVSPRWPGLHFVGFFNVSGGANIRMMDVQCRWLAAVLAGEVELPGEEEMLADIADQNRRTAALYPATPRYGLELDPREYGLALREDLRRAAEGSSQASAERRRSGAVAPRSGRAEERDPVGS